MDHATHHTDLHVNTLTTPAPSHTLTTPTPPPLCVTYAIYQGTQITPALLETCAALFSSQYGVWGRTPDGVDGPPQGSRVKMSPKRLRGVLGLDSDDTVLVVCYHKSSGHGDNAYGSIVGHAFGTAWDFEGGRVGWVTQLVVDANFRRRYIATQMLYTMIKQCPVFANITCIGIVSSHPAACAALTKQTRYNLHNIDLDYCRHHARSIKEASPVSYIKNMQLHGSLFDAAASQSPADGSLSDAAASQSPADGSLFDASHVDSPRSCAFTNFYVDHAEPLEALRQYRARDVGGQRRWGLGALLEGYEFLVVLPTAPVS